MTPATHTTFEVVLEVLSPVAIQSGEQLSPLSDFFELDNKLYYVDPDKLIKALADDSELMQKYTQIMDDQPSEGRSLKDLIKDNTQLRAISTGQPVDFYGKSTVQMNAIIKTNGCPYIPGSSIKGAIKNAILYDWLLKNNSVINEFLQNNITSFQESSENIRQLKKNIKHECRKQTAILNEFFEEISQKAFAISPRKDRVKQPAGNLLIRDSSLIDIAHMAVASSTRINIDKQKNEDSSKGIPALQEYLQRGTTCTTAIRYGNSCLDWIDVEKNSIFGRMVYDQSNLSALFKVLNRFYQDTKDLYHAFGLEQITDTPGPNEAMLYLGSGKGIYRNTVLLAFKKYYDAQALNFNKDFVPILYPKLINIAEFPASMVHINNSPLGWVKITDPNKAAYLDQLQKSYTQEELESGQPIEGIFKEEGKPDSIVTVLIEGVHKDYQVKGTKKYKARYPLALQPNTACTVYWRNNDLNFNP